jgi:pyruvate formate-lyase activating enzyme-like uncharacterized protein
MKRELFFPLCLTTSIIAFSCKDNKDAAEFFNRPQINECITLDQKGKMACNGEVLDIPSSMILMKSWIDEDLVRDYYSDKEFRLYICLRYPKNCK